MLVAITGGTGFIGRRLAVSHLERGDRLRVLTRRRVTGFEGRADIFHADLAVPEADLRPFVEGADILYHCAGQLTDERRMHSVHVEGTGRLVRAATGRVGRWVQLSSVGAYGPRGDGIVMEDTPETLLKGIYERTKAESDALVIAAGGGLEHVILRPSTVYGPEMPNQALFQLIGMIACGLFFFIGPPGAIVNYVHVQSVVNALIACGTRAEARGRTYILSDNRSLEEAVQTIATALGRPVPRLRLPFGPVLLIARLVGRLPGIPLKESRVRALTQRVVYDGSRIESELGYCHSVILEQGLHEMVDFWQSQR